VFPGVPGRRSKSLSVSMRLVDEWSGLDKKVAEHGVRFPATEEADDVGVHVSAEEGHGSPSMKGVGRDVVGGKADGVANGGSGHMEGCHDVLGEDATLALVGVVIGCQGDVQWGLVVAVVEEASDGGMYGATEVVARCSLAQGFALDSILLGSEGVCDVVGCQEVMFRKILPREDAIVME